MSNSRRPPLGPGLRPNPGRSLLADRRHVSPGVYSSSSSVSSHDGALKLLSSCGLEPADLALLAELPEDVLTVESLPHVLRQLKGRRGSVQAFPPDVSVSSSSYPRSCSRRPPGSPAPRDPQKPFSQMLHFQPDQVEPSPPPPNLNRGGALQSLSYAVDPRYGPGSRERSRAGRAGRAAGPGSAQEGRKRIQTPGLPDLDYRLAPPPEVAYRPAPPPEVDYRPAPPPEVDYRPAPPPEVDYRPAPPPEVAYRPALPPEVDYRPAPPPEVDYRPAPPPEVAYRPALPPEVYPNGRRHQGAPSSSRVQSGSATPSSKEALDFHGTPPLAFPYSCALCDITVMSQKVWAAHINTSQHADGQLRLLQRFPNWDCRMEPASRVDNQSQTWAEPRQAQAANQSSAALTNQKMKKKASEKSKVVCVKFPAASVDEAHLRSLTEPFGRIVKILMFSSLAFVELGSVDQAKDLVKLYQNQPVTVNGQQMEFKMSHTFSFLQSSLVVSFSPAPSGEDGRSDLLSVVSRFGTPLYTLFLPSKAFVEMKESLEAQKLVHYYSSNTLRINEDVIQVSFSGEYKTLTRVASARRYQEESRSLKRGSSGQKDGTEDAKRGRGNSRTRSRSSEKSAKERPTRSRSRERSAQEAELASSDKSSREGGSTSRSREGPSEDRRSRSTSTEKGRRLSPSRTRSNSREKLPHEKNTVTSRDEGHGERFRSRETSCSDGPAGSGTTDEPSKEETRTRTTESNPSSAETHRSRDTPRSPSTEARSQPEPEPEPDSGSCDELQSAESDIEGMEVIGEDGQSLEDEDTETLDEAEREEEVEKGAAEKEDPEEREPDEEQRDERTGEDQETVLEEEKTETQLEDKEDLDSCITLDELEEEEPNTSTSQRPGEATSEDIRDPPEKNAREDPDTVSGPGLVQTTERKEPEPQNPNKPIGVEFVRPVVGYFCNLCQQIYADEDEAKVVHCSTAAHYRKYQEKTGKDPRTSWT